MPMVETSRNWFSWRAGQKREAKQTNTNNEITSLQVLSGARLFFSCRGRTVIVVVVVIIVVVVLQVGRVVPVVAINGLPFRCVCQFSH